MTDQVQTSHHVVDGKTVKVDRYEFKPGEVQICASVLNRRGEIEHFEKFDFDYDPAQAAASAVTTAAHNRWVNTKDVSFAVMETANQYGGIAIRSAILINGAAAIALLAFISQHWNPGQGLEESLKPLFDVLVHLITGVLSGGASAGFAYISVSLVLWAEARRIKVGTDLSKGWLVFQVIAQLAAFVSGVYAYARFTIAINKVGEVLTVTKAATAAPSGWAIFAVGAFAALVAGGVIAPIFWSKKN